MIPDISTPPKLWSYFKLLLLDSFADLDRDQIKHLWSNVKLPSSMYRMVLKLWILLRLALHILMLILFLTNILNRQLLIVTEYFPPLYCYFSLILLRWKSSKSTLKVLHCKFLICYVLVSKAHKFCLLHCNMIWLFVSTHPAWTATSAFTESVDSCDLKSAQVHTLQNHSLLLTTWKL